MPPLVEIFLAHYRAHIADGSRLFPGVAETLAALKAAGARLGVLTNKPQELTDPLLPLLGLDGHVRRRLWRGPQALYQAGPAHLP